MIEYVPALTPSERRAVSRLIDRVVRRGDPRARRAVLFGSKARGDFDAGSDVDVLFILDVPIEDRDAASLILADDARAVRRATGVAVETWAVPVADLACGGRTPMLIDALDDGVPLWPPGAPPIRLEFTPADARFCADRLIDWVDEGGPIVRRAIGDRCWDLAAQRIRDDITRLATAALLLAGDTRHRRTSSLLRFEARFVRTGIVSRCVLPALDWAAAAYPPGDGRGIERPPATPAAIASVRRGLHLAATMEAEVLPILLAIHADARGAR